MKIGNIDIWLLDQQVAHNATTAEKKRDNTLKNAFCFRKT